MKRVFLSHASTDKSVALELKSYLQESLPGTEVFLSSSPGAIEISSIWLDKVLEELEQCDAGVFLVSFNSVHRLWLGFELGWLWNRFKGGLREGRSSMRLYGVMLGQIEVPSPLNWLQTGALNNSQTTEEFLKQLAKDLGTDFKPREEPSEFVRRLHGTDNPFQVEALRAYPNSEQWQGFTDSPDQRVPANAVTNGVWTWYCKLDPAVSIRVNFDEGREVVGREQVTLPIGASEHTVYVTQRYGPVVQYSFLLLYDDSLFVPKWSTFPWDGTKNRHGWHKRFMPEEFAVYNIIDWNPLERDLRDVASDLGLYYSE